MNIKCAAVYVVTLGALFPAITSAATCNVSSGSGQSCVMQFSTVTRGAPHCTNGVCYTKRTKKTLKALAAAPIKSSAGTATTKQQ
jgi:hypothetical protein